MMIPRMVIDQNGLARPYDLTKEMAKNGSVMARLALRWRNLQNAELYKRLEPWGA